MPPRPADPDAIAAALAAPFDAGELKWKPTNVSGNRALALPYVGAQAVMQRLDDVLGVAGWQDAYEPLPDGSVLCRLRLRIGGEWLERCDAGGQSAQKESGNRTKAAHSDALKRAAVKWGVGRYLARLPRVWCDYDSVKREFVRTPQLPAGERGSRGAGEKAGGGSSLPAPPLPLSPAAKLPRDGADLRRRLGDHDARLAAEGCCRPGDLVKHVVAAGVKAGHPADLAAWAGPAMQLAVEETKRFEAAARAKTRQPAA